MARNPFEQLMDQVLSGIWRLICGIVKLFFSLLGSGIAWLWRKATAKSAVSENTSEGNGGAFLSEAKRHWAALEAARSNDNWPEIVSCADKALKPLNELRTQFEATRNPMITDIRFLLADTLYGRWQARAQIVPEIGAPNQGETCEDVVKRRAERDAAVNSDLEMSHTLIKQAAEGSPQIDGITPERIEDLASFIEVAKMKVTRIRTQGPAYLDDKIKFRSDPAQFKGGLYRLGITGERAGFFDDFSNFAEEMIAANPTSITLLNGASEAYEYGIDSSKIECQGDETAKKTIGYLKLANRHNAEALRIDRENAHSLYIRGIICSRLDDTDGLAEALDRLRPIELLNPWTDDERKTYSDIRQFVWPSRTAALEAILGIHKRKLAEEVEE